MYGRKLEEFLFHRNARVVTFADNSYVLLEGDTKEEVIALAED